MGTIKIDKEKFSNLVESDMGKTHLLELLENCEVKDVKKKLTSDKIVTVTLETKPENCYIVESNQHSHYERIYNNKSTSMFKEVAFKVIMFLMDDNHKEQILKNEIFQEDF